MDPAALIPKLFSFEEFGIDFTDFTIDGPGSCLSSPESGSAIGRCLRHLASIGALKASQREASLRDFEASTSHSLQSYAVEYGSDLEECCQGLTAILAKRSFIARRLQENLTRREYLTLRQDQKSMFTEFIAHADELQKQERKWQRQLRSVLSGISQHDMEQMRQKLREMEAACAGVDQGLLLLEKLGALRAQLLEAAIAPEELERSKENDALRQNGRHLLWSMPEEDFAAPAEPVDS